MTPAEIFGWSGTVAGAILALPQLVRLVRTRHVEGLSLPAWQALLASFMAWSVHGITIGQPPQYITALLSVATAVPIVVLLARHLRRSIGLALAPVIAAAAAMVAVDQLWGSAAFGLIALVPAVIGNAGQTVALIRSAHVTGVAPGFLILGFVNQVFWVTWAMLVDDAGTIIVAATTAAITGLNLGWYIARRAGLRAFWQSAASANDPVDTNPGVLQP